MYIKRGIKNCSGEFVSSFSCSSASQCVSSFVQKSCFGGEFLELKTESLTEAYNSIRWCFIFILMIKLCSWKCPFLVPLEIYFWYLLLLNQSQFCAHASQMSLSRRCSSQGEDADKQWSLDICLLHSHVSFFWSFTINSSLLKISMALLKLMLAPEKERSSASLILTC